jgi:hypothetical protein
MNLASYLEGYEIKGSFKCDASTDSTLNQKKSLAKMGIPCYHYTLFVYNYMHLIRFQ